MTAEQQATLQILRDRVYQAKLRLKRMTHDRAPLDYLTALGARVDKAERALEQAEREAM